MARFGGLGSVAVLVADPPEGRRRSTEAEAVGALLRRSGLFTSVGVPRGAGAPADWVVDDVRVESTGASRVACLNGPFITLGVVPATASQQRTTSFRLRRAHTTASEAYVIRVDDEPGQVVGWAALALRGSDRWTAPGGDEEQERRADLVALAIAQAIGAGTR